MKSSTKKQISISIFRETDHSSQRFSVSQFFFSFTVISVFVAACLTGFIAIRCNAIKKTLPSPASLKASQNSQAQLISQQSEQINLLRVKLKTLDEKFENLQGMKNEICKIGRIEQPLKHENLFGVGGSRPETTSKGVDTEASYGLNGRTDEDRPSVGNLDINTNSDRDMLNGRLLVLNHSDFFINPIACIPSSPPINAAVTQQIQKTEHLITRTEVANQGIMIKTIAGSDVIAPANGIITFVDTKGNAGETVIIDHGHGYITRYTCLESVAKKRGELVFKGDVIGQAQTGASEEPTPFYYEIILNGLPVNPKIYINHNAFLL